MTLKPNDIVLIISPAGRVSNENLDNAVRILKSWGLNVVLGKYVKSEYYNFSGTIEQRLSDLQWALDHPTAKAIFASRGGYGLIQLLDKVDWTLFQKKSKLLIGYSDITNLSVQINNIGGQSLHALMPNSFPKAKEHQKSLTSLKSALFDETYTLDWYSPLPVADGEITGELVGGNLSILYSLQGTPYAPKYNGKILFIEEINEYLYHTDRMLRSLDYAGVFSDIKALLIGDFTKMQDNDVPFGQTIEEIITAVAQKNNVPVIFGLKTGHDDPTLALPMGQRAVLTVKDARCTLSF